MDILCTADMCPVILNATCVFYEGNSLLYTGITTNDSLQTALQKIDAKFGDAMVGYTFTNGVYQSVAGAPVGLGGSLTADTTIGGNFTLTFAGNVKAAKHITTGGNASQFVKGDGTLDSNAYQVAGNYITALTGDVIANGPGSAAASLAVVNTNPGTYGSGTRIPVVTVDTKGRVTALTTTAINVPSGSLSFVGDVYGSGVTGSQTTLTLNNVNSNVYTNNTFLKFKVNAKGLVTGAAPITHVDIEGVLGYVPVPETRTISINGVVRDLQTNAVFVLPGGGSVTNVSATAGTGINVSVTNPTTTPNITITNTAPDQIVSIGAGTGINVTGTYPNFTIAATNIGSVTNVTASAPLASSGGTTPNITISQASGSTDGYLSSTDWNTFNGKQSAGNYITALTGEATASGPGSVSVTLSTPAVTGKLLTGVNITGGSIVDTDSILTAFGKVQNQINGLIGGSIYKGTWNASTNTPTITSGVGTTGWYYIVSVPGTTNIDGITDWNLGDWIIFDGTAWQQVDNTDAVVSVNGYTGAVSLVSSDIPEGLTNLYYTPARARTAISLTTTGTSGAATYDNITGVFNIPNYTTDLSGYVPYTGATTNVNLGERGITAGYVGFDLTPTGTPTGIGTMYWDPAYRTVNLIDGDGDTTLQIGQEERILVHNNTGSPLTDGQVVYVTGSTGNLPSVSLADASSETTSAATLGVVTETIANGADGFVTVNGIVNGLNTLAFAEGDLLWLSETAGQYTNVKPIAPAHLVLIGYVIKRAGGNGSILVKIQNTQELSESSDVLISAPELDGQGLFLQTISGVQLWRNRTIADVLGYTPANGANYLPLAGGTLSGNLTISNNYTVSGDSGLYIIDPNYGAVYTKIIKPAGLPVLQIWGPGPTDAGSLVLTLSPITNTSTFTTNLTATSFIKSGGTSSQYLMADGSVSTGPSLTGYVPYTGATTNLALGDNNFSSKRVSVLKSSDGFGGYTSNYLFLETGSSTTNVGTNGISLYSKPNTRALIVNYDISGTGRATILDASSLSADRTFTFPDANGTLALTSDIPSLAGYVPTTRTLTINGTTYDLSANRSWTISSSGVPYTGATGPVNLGAYDLTVNSIQVGRGGGNIADNTRLGNLALGSNTTGTSNTAVGNLSLYANTTGGSNSSFGVFSLLSNTTGNSNTSVGSSALYANTTGNSNVAVGTNTLQNNTTGGGNTGTGVQVLKSNTTGIYNTGSGANALYDNTTGSYNTAIGNNAGLYLTTGNNNTLIGGYTGTAGMASNVVLSDGGGNIRFQYNGTNTLLGQSGNVGIGTSVISQNFSGYTHLDIGNATTGGILLFSNASGTNYGYVNGEAGGVNMRATVGNLTFNTGASERMRITSGGQVLIGQSVASGTTNGIYFRPGIESGFIVTNDVAIQLGRLGSTGDIQTFYSGSTRVGKIAVQSSSFTFESASNGGITVNSSGNVGIGNSPLAALGKTLTVEGTIISQTTVGGGNYNESFRGNRTGNGYAAIAIGGAYGSVSGTGAGQWTFAATPSSTGTPYALDFDYAGSTVIKFGTGGNLFTNGGNGYHVSHRPIAGATFNIGYSGGNIGTNGPFINATYNGTADTTPVPIFFNCSAYSIFVGYSEQFRLVAGGTLYIGGGIVQYYGSWSDRTLKENLEVIANPLEKISKLTGYTFDWTKDSPYRNNPAIGERIKDAGLIAQDVEEVLPEVVTEKDKKKHVNYNGVTALHTEGIKELIKENQELKNRLSLLEERLALIESKLL